VGEGWGEGLPPRTPAFAAPLIRRGACARTALCADLAADVGIDRTYASRLKRGMENPTVPLLERLAAALECDIGAFFVTPRAGEKFAAPAPEAGRRGLNRAGNYFSLSSLRSFRREGSAFRLIDWRDQPKKLLCLARYADAAYPTLRERREMLRCVIEFTSFVAMVALYIRIGTKTRLRFFVLSSYRKR
jgi:transcriptional regulator with XRE-family HTH domain